MPSVDSILRGSHAAERDVFQQAPTQKVSIEDEVYDCMLLYLSIGLLRACMRLSVHAIHVNKYMLIFQGSVI